jgi:hypothetical protein
MAQRTTNNDLPAPGPTCQHLRSKGMYITGQRELDGQTVDGNCWCAKTQGSLGPDDNFVGRLRCSSARKCYQAVL